MMELPESHTLSCQINEILQDKVILHITANKSPHKFAWFTGDPENYPGLLTGKKYGLRNPMAVWLK